MVILTQSVYEMVTAQTDSQGMVLLGLVGLHALQYFFFATVL